MVGNAHIDPVWLWRWPAGVDEALATFRAAADRCDEYPEFVYTRGEAWLYRWVERLDPALFGARGRARRSAGVAPTGGLVVQPDANLPTEEGWRRQLRHGRRYFADRFGVRPTVGLQRRHVRAPGDAARPAGGGGLRRPTSSTARTRAGRAARAALPLARQRAAARCSASASSRAT